MPAKDLLSPVNLIFLIGGIYFGILVATRETAVVVLSAMVLCLISFILAYGPDYFLSSAWRTATSVFVIFILAAQVGENIIGFSNVNVYNLSSFVVNGAFLLFFVGTLLVSAKSLASQEEEEPGEKVSERKSEPAKAQPIAA